MIFFFLLGRHKSTSMKIGAGLLKKRKFIIIMHLGCLSQTSDEYQSAKGGITAWPKCVDTPLVPSAADGKGHKPDMKKSSCNLYEIVDIVNI